MTGKFIITREMLEQYGACDAGMKLFNRNHPDGKGEYQTLLDEACAAGRADFASWLLFKVGPTEDVLKLDEINDPDGSIVFAGAVEIAKSAVLKSIEAGEGIEAGDDIKAGGHIEAGRYIEAGEGIKAGRGINAGWYIRAGGHIEAGEGIEAGWGIEAGRDIKAGWGIEAGENFGIHAGLRARITDHRSRTVRAKSKPNNLMCGEFEEVK